MGLEGSLSAEFKRFRRDQVSSSKRDFEVTDIKKLRESIKSSQVVYLGDFHSFDQSTRNFERLLRTLEGEKIILGVEFVYQEHQEYLEFYLTHLITELEFLESINYRESWRFPWTYYRHFFEMAQRKEFPIIALNSVGSLKERDQLAANKISELLKENPDSKILVLFGEYHIVADKLPRLTSECYGPELKQTIIHQNLDEVYWKLRDHEQEAEIIAFNDDEFSLQTSPPWVKYESQIYWYENLTDDPDFDLHEYIMETGLLAFNSTISDNFFFLAKEISRTIGEEVDEENLEDFNLYDYQRLDVVSEKLESLEEKKCIQFYRWLLEQGSGFFLPHRNIFYSSTYSINRMSYLAGIHVLRTIRSEIHTESENALLAGGEQFFTFWFFSCATGYFCSKIINPYRKCDLYLDLRDHYQNPATKKELIRPLGLTLSLIESMDKGVAADFSDYSHKELYQSARALGFMYAERMYEGHLKANSRHIDDLKNMLFKEEWNLETLGRFCLTIVPEDSYLKLRKRFF